MKTLEDRIDGVLDYAQDKFWEEIKKAFPEIMTGDVDVKADNEFNVACDIIVRHWYNNNKVGHHTPSATYHALKQLKNEFPEMEWEDTSYGNDASDSLECIVNGSVKVRIWMQNPEEGEDYKDFVVCESKNGEDFNDANDVALTDFQQVVEFIRLTYTKPPRKPILWCVFDVKDVKGIKAKSGFDVGEGYEIQPSEDDAYVMLSQKNNAWIFIRKDGRFYTESSNDGALGTLEECIQCLERNNEEPVE